MLVAPFAPHIAEELWKRLGNTESVAFAPYPVHEDKYLQEDSKEYPVSFNGKVRFKRAYATSMTPAEIEQAHPCPILKRRTAYKATPLKR